MKTLDVGLDIDGVLYPFDTMMTRRVEQTKGLRPGTLDDHALTWHWYRDQWGMSDEEFVTHLRNGVKYGVLYSAGFPTAGAVAAVRRMADAGHRIHYITNRDLPGLDPGLVRLRTREWLNSHGFHVDSLTVSADKTLVRTDVFLDDRPENIRALKDAGHPCAVLWDKPYNRHVNGTRVNDFHEFELLVRYRAHVAEFTPVTPSEDHGTLGVLLTTTKDAA